ncbi:MAG TPA: ATP-grasp domain-containing protein, partial [Prolixibacteraceae bacterium]
MKIHEYQARQIFRNYGIPVPASVLCYTVREVEKAARDFNCMVVVKAQVLAGGRGKAGGVKLAKNIEEAINAGKQILGMTIKGLTVEKVIVTPAADIEKEFYIGFVNDRNTKTVTLMASAEGGVEIEEVAKNNPEKIIKYPVNPLTGLLDYQARNIALQLFGNIKHAQKAASVLTKLYKLFIETDSTLAEINPLILTTNNEVLAIDGKMNFDDNALYRQPEILAMREPDEEEIQEIAAHEKGLS